MGIKYVYLKRFFPNSFFMRALLLPLLFSTLLFSCNKKESAPKDIEKENLDIRIKALWDCNLATASDSGVTASKLMGSWRLETSIGGWTGDITHPDKEIAVIFRPDHTLTLKTDGRVVLESSWKLKREDATLWGLQLDSTVDYAGYLGGRILVCDNDLMFNKSYLDGSDHLFSKVP